ncbi:MAG: transglutaminase-like domain-containing protein [archaeon]|nr:transglutaminase-like domain-containing protein [archaeon]MDA0842595.1 transglutaminase-like domain-containing protein [archaeon]
MPSCRYCNSVTLPGDKICYNCGRVIASNREGGYRLEQQFDEGSKESTFMMAKQPRQKGIVMTKTGRERNIFKRRKNRFRSLALVVFIAFVFLSPQAREALLGEFNSIDEFIASATATYLPYPVEATYTVSKTSIVKEFNGYGAERIVLPPKLTSNMNSNSLFQYDDGESEDSIVLQQTLKVEVIVGSERFNIPVNGLPHTYYGGLGSSSPITASDGTKIWHPGVFDESSPLEDEKYYCNVANCIMIQPAFNGAATASYTFEATISATSYSWWDHSRVDSRVPGKEFGINVENSGTLTDYALRSSEFAADFSNNQHYPNDYGEYKIDSNPQEIVFASAQISQRIPEGMQDNAYAFARATFDYLHEKVTYDKFAPVEDPRSGAECLAASKGDCDEQTNAFLSILRSKGIPGWYVFGLLNDYTFSDIGWEAHAWGYIQLPLSDEWCENKGITLASCFVNAQVDVVNNKWLLSTTTAYVDWVEEFESKDAENVYNYYRPKYPGSFDRDRIFSTIGNVDFAQGSFQVKKYPEYFK